MKTNKGSLIIGIILNLCGIGLLFISFAGETISLNDIISAICFIIFGDILIILYARANKKTASGAVHAEASSLLHDDGKNIKISDKLSVKPFIKKRLWLLVLFFLSGILFLIFLFMSKPGPDSLAVPRDRMLLAAFSILIFFVVPAAPVIKKFLLLRKVKKLENGQTISIYAPFKMKNIKGANYFSQIPRADFILYADVIDPRTGNISSFKSEHITVCVKNASAMLSIMKTIEEYLKNDLEIILSARDKNLYYVNSSRIYEIMDKLSS